MDQLCLATTQSGNIKAEGPFWQTNVSGVFAAGDCSTPYEVIAGAITSGCNTAVVASAEIPAAKYSQPLKNFVRLEYDLALGMVGRLRRFTLEVVYLI